MKIVLVVLLGALMCQLRMVMAIEAPLRVFPSFDTLHETQSKILTIYGAGFTNATNVSVTLHPTFEGAYKIIGVYSDSIRVQLMPGESWLGYSSFFSPTLNDERKKILLTLMSIDIGEVEIFYDMPLPVGYIVKERQGVTCDDSCEFAFDGVCDDSSVAEADDHYYKDSNNIVLPRRRTSANPSQSDDYYMENEAVVVCEPGTDCTDCGGVDNHIITVLPNQLPCTNTCIFINNGVCDDLRGTMYCELGTDCQDCGPVDLQYLTRSDDDDDGLPNEDDINWNVDDRETYTSAEPNERKLVSVVPKPAHQKTPSTDLDHRGSIGLILVVAVLAIVAVALIVLCRKPRKGAHHGVGVHKDTCVVV